MNFKVNTDNPVVGIKSGMYGVSAALTKGMQGIDFLVGELGSRAQSIASLASKSDIGRTASVVAETVSAAPLTTAYAADQSSRPVSAKIHNPQFNA